MSMANAERDQLKIKLREMIAEGDDGIDLDTDFRWVISGIKQPEPFFRNLSFLLSPDCILYFEGCTIASDVSNFYKSHKAGNTVAVRRDTIFPDPECFHVSFTPEVIDRLCKFAASHQSNELFDHVKAYRGKELIFTFHDALAGDLLVSEQIIESAVAKFSGTLGIGFHREPNIRHKRSEGLETILKAMENPRKVRIRGESWWNRLRRCWTWK